MSNETKPGAPLAASVGERLGGDPHVEEVIERVAHEAAPGGGDARPDAGAPPAQARSGGEKRPERPGGGEKASRSARKPTPQRSGGGEAQQRSSGGETPQRTAGAGEPDAERKERRRGGAPSPARPAGRPFPWALLAVAAVGWAALSAIGGGVRERARRVAAGARRLATALPRG
jgi:hypothetical protein